MSVPSINPQNPKLQKIKEVANCDWQVGDQIADPLMRLRTVVDIYVGGSDDSQLFVSAQDERGDKATQPFSYWDKNGWIKIPVSIDELRAEALQALVSPSVIEGVGGKIEETATALTTTTSDTASIEAIKQRAIKAERKALLIQRMVEQMLEPIKAMRQTMVVRIKYLSSILEVLEAYVGIYEELSVVQEGTPAPADTPITFRQLCLFMDEEAGITDWLGGTQGINWQNVDAFDEWLRQDAQHLNQVAPEPKCVVALKPSRQHRDRGDWWLNHLEDQANQMLYLLIRNGENVYRIWAGFPLGKLLFPSIKEWETLMERVEAEKDAPHEAYKWQGVQLGWNRNIALLQGLIDRTECLHPLASEVNLFSPDKYELVHLIRDGEENMLPSGVPTYQEWRKTTNQEITRGSRIYLAPVPYDCHNDGWRFSGNMERGPSLPDEGVYTVEEVAHHESPYSHYVETRIKILFHPGDEVWDKDAGRGWGEYRPRIRRVAFCLTLDDHFFLNYDHLDVSTLRYHIANRLERPNYLEILPVLCGLLSELEKEQAEERQFAELMASTNGIAIDDVFAGIEWWKNKTIAKRPIRQDDEKAWRMILRHINSIQH